MIYIIGEFYSKNKTDIILDIKKRLEKGETINIKKAMEYYGKSDKSIRLYIEKLSLDYFDKKSLEGKNILSYDRTSGGYVLDRSKLTKSESKRVSKNYFTEMDYSNFTKEEVLVLSKMLFDSRGLPKKELLLIINKLFNQISKEEQKEIHELIGHEFDNYLPIQANKGEKTKLIPKIGKLSAFIHEQESIKVKYKNRNDKTSEFEVNPVGIMFSDFYFYLIVFSKKDKYPKTLRIDRITYFQTAHKKFELNTSNKEHILALRNQVKFMFNGERKELKFTFKGNQEIILDNLPQARSIEKDKKNNPIFKVVVFGDGVERWLKSFDDLVYDLKVNVLKHI